MVRFHIWFVVLVLVGGPLTAGYFLGFDVLEEQSRRAAEGAVREDAALAQGKLARVAEEAVKEAQLLSQRASLHDELLPIAAATGNPLAARDKIKAAFERLNPAADLLVVADTRGAILYRGKDAQEDFALPLLSEAMRGLPTAQAVPYRGQLYYVAVAPVLSGTHVVGAFGLGRKPGQDFVEKLVATKGAGIALASSGKVVAANLAARERGELQKHLSQIQAGRTRDVTLAGKVFNVHATQLALPGLMLVHAREATVAGGVEDTRLMYLYIAGGVFLLALFWGFLLQRAHGRPGVLLLARVQALANQPGDASVNTEGLGSPYKQIANAVNDTLARTRSWAQSLVAARTARGQHEIRVEGPTASTMPARDPTGPIVAAAPSPAAVQWSPAAPAVTAPAQPAVVVAPAAAAPVVAPAAAAAPAAGGDPNARTLMGIGFNLPPAASADPLDGLLPQLHEQFLSARRECAEPTEGVSFDKFAEKVRRVRADLMAQHGCEEVDFEVYKRSGRAALRATPKRRVEATVH